MLALIPRPHLSERLGGTDARTETPVGEVAVVVVVALETIQARTAGEAHRWQHARAPLAAAPVEVVTPVGIEGERVVGAWWILRLRALVVGMGWPVGERVLVSPGREA